MAVENITTRFAGVCACCGDKIKSGKRVLFNRATGDIYHDPKFFSYTDKCAQSAYASMGDPGDSALDEEDKDRRAFHRAGF